MNAMRKQAVPATSLFHPIEHAILADYLGVKPPKCARCISTLLDEELQPENDEIGVVRLRPDLWDDVSNFVVHNAISPFGAELDPVSASSVGHRCRRGQRPTGPRLQQPPEAGDIPFAAVPVRDQLGGQWPRILLAGEVFRYILSWIRAIYCHRLGRLSGCIWL